MTRWEPRARWGLWSVATIGAALALGYLSQEPTSTVLLLGIAGVCLLPVIVRLGQRKFDVFEPYIFFLFGWVVMFVFHTWSYRSSPYLVAWSAIIDLHRTYKTMLVIGLLGSAAFVVGYALPIGRSVGSKVRAPSTEDLGVGALTTAALAISVLGALLYYMYLRSIHAGLGAVLSGRTATLGAGYNAALGTNAYYRDGTYFLVPAAVLLIGLGAVRRDSGVRVLGTIIGGILLIRGVGLGDRLLLLPVVAGCFLLFYLQRGRRPGVMVVLGLALALFAVTIIGENRTAQVRQSQSLAATSLSTIRHPSTVMDTLTSNAGSAEALDLAGALTAVPNQFGWQYGAATLGDLFIRPIPHTLWPGKPLPPTQRVIQLVWPVGYANHTANPVFTAAFSFYVDLGLAGVAIGLLLYGVAARALYEFYLANDDKIVAQVVFAIGSPLMIAVARDAFVDSVVRAAFIFVPLVLIIRFSTRATPAVLDVGEPTVERFGHGAPQI